MGWSKHWKDVLSSIHGERISSSSGTKHDANNKAETVFSSSPDEEGF
jgi:hypothetical protein